MWRKRICLDPLSIPSLYIQTFSLLFILKNPSLLPSATRICESWNFLLALNTFNAFNAKLCVLITKKLFLSKSKFLLLMLLLCVLLPVRDTLTQAHAFVFLLLFCCFSKFKQNKNEEMIRNFTEVQKTGGLRLRRSQASTLHLLTWAASLLSPSRFLSSEVPEEHWLIWENAQTNSYRLFLAQNASH